MRVLADLQRQISASIRGVDPVPVPGVYRPTDLPSGDPLSVYRNNHRISLTGALTITFPTVAKLIGPAAMQVLSERFLAQHPPLQPCVAEYGSDFAPFLARQAEMEAVPYLSDLAKLDWSLNEARLAADAAPFAAQDLAAMGLEQLRELRVKPHPSLTLLRSAFRIARIHDAIHGGLAIDLAEANGDSSLMIWRQTDAVRIVAIRSDAFAGAQALAQVRPLSDACESLRETSIPEFLAFYLCSGAFVRLPHAGSDRHAVP